MLIHTCSSCGSPRREESHSGVAFRTYTLSGDTSEGVNRIKDVRKELISLSHQAERIKEAAFEMVIRELRFGHIHCPGSRRPFQMQPL
jgi:hypothetical protein